MHKSSAKNMQGTIMIANDTIYMCDVRLISRKALDVFFSKLPQPPTSAMASRLGKEIFSNVRIVRVKGDNMGTDYELVPRSEMGAYAEHFKKLQGGAKVVLTGKCGGSDKTMGYSVVSIYRPEPSHSVLAFVHKDAGDGKVVMIATTSEAHHTAAMVYITTACHMTSFSKICCECGQTCGNLMKCGCRKVRYCSKDCQTAHWEEHRAKCAFGGAKAKGA